MNKITFICTLVCFLMLACSQPDAHDPTINSTTTPNQRKGTNTMTKLDIGAFSVSLAVKNLATSRSFYEKLGFAKVGGDPTQNWVILRNGDTTIGLFQEMLPGNVLTFNPGWNSLAEPIDDFMDVRDIQKRLKDAGLNLTAEADESTNGPASLMLTDPDGNMIMLDQHVD